MSRSFCSAYKALSNLGVALSNRNGSCGLTLARGMASKRLRPRPSMAMKPARTAENYEKIKKMTTKQLEGWNKFKLPITKTIKRRFAPLISKKAHPWLYKSKPLLPEGIIIRPRREKEPVQADIKALRSPYVFPPFEERQPSHKFLMKTLGFEETKKIEHNWPRAIEPFKTGDRIKITKYVQLNRDSKLEVVKGMCIGRSFKGLESYFRILNYKIDVQYEMNIPLWSPFIKSIEVVKKNEKIRRMKAYWMAGRHYKEYITK